VFYNATARTFSECRACPEGAVCPGRSNMTVSARYYVVCDANTLATETFLCDGGRCAADGHCSPNRVAAADNPLCGRCMPGYSEWDGTCVACPGANGGVILGLLVLAWTCVLALHGLTQRSSANSALRIAMFFWQVALLIVGGTVWLRWAAVLDLNFVVAGGASVSVCPFPVSPHGMLVLQLLGPLLSFVLLVVSAALHRLLSPSTEARCRLPGFELAAYWRSCVTLYFVTFNSVTRACLDFFNCVTLPSGRYMVALPAVRCDEHAYRRLIPLVMTLLAMYVVVVPGFIGYRLRGAVHRQAQVQEDTHARVWSVVYGPLRAGASWWSMVQMLARAALVATAVYLRANDSTRNAVFTLLNVVLAMSLLLLRPNRNADDNAWELATLSALALLALSEIMGAKDAWLIVLTLGVGGAAVIRLCAQSLRRLLRSGDPDLDGADPDAGDSCAREAISQADDLARPLNWTSSAYVSSRSQWQPSVAFESSLDGQG
jgi:hypothetical protein